MEKTTLQQQLQTNHEAFMALLDQLSAAEFNLQFADKWTAGQQLEHIIRSVEPVALAFSLPAFVPRFLFGKPNRPSRTYQDLVKKYHSKLDAGGKAPNNFVPKSVDFKQKKALLVRLSKVLKRLDRGVQRFSENDLDAYLLPHPLLGKLTFREMIFFTIYHVEHHHLATQRNLTAASRS